MKNISYYEAAYIVVWMILMGYIYFLHMKLNSLEDKESNET